MDLDTFPKWLEQIDERYGGDDETNLSVLEENICPPPPSSVNTKTSPLCNSTVCSHNGNCSFLTENSTSICCFNGCVKTCMRPYKIKPPLVFDWTEDSPGLRRVVVPEHEPSAHSSPAELMSLPGGCFLTPTQFESLKVFEEDPHVSHCFCNVGSVFCKIKE